jgi:hypothetical protein
MGARARGETGHQQNVTHGDPLDAFNVASRADWLAAGLSVGKFRELIRAGRLVRVRYGAYATAGAVEAGRENASVAHALLSAAVIACSGRGTYVASHESAALIHGLNLLRQPPEGAVTMTREPAGAGASGRVRRQTGVTVHVAGLPDAHVREVSGVRVTTVERTVLDLARSLPFMDAVVVADDAIHRAKTAKGREYRVLADCKGWPATSQAKRVIDFSNGLAESALESCARVAFDRAGLPRPELQVVLGVGDGNSARVDFLWREYETIVELDGMLKYDDPANPGAMRRQFDRDRKLRDRGYKVVHVTWRELFHEPELVIARIKKAFADSTVW